MPLRAYLVSLTLAALLPVAVFAGAVAYLLVAEQREVFRRGAEARALAVSTAVDIEQNGIITTLQVLATLPAFEDRDLATIRDRAARILLTQPHWSNINVALPSGQQVMNLQRPAGATLPNIAESEPEWGERIEARMPWISDLMVGPITRDWDYAVRVPVIRNGELKYVVSAVVRPESLSRLLAAQQLPADWVGVVLDRRRRIVARNVNAPSAVGQLASQSLRDALAGSADGWFHGSTIEGTEVYTPYRSSPATGWVFAMGIPAAVVDAASWRAVWLLGAGLLSAVAIALVLARQVSRRVAGPIAALASAAGAIARAEKIDLARKMRIDEIRAVAAALEECAVAIGEHHQLVEREKQALLSSDRAKSEFLATLSHELRNPLAAMSAAADLLAVSGPAHDETAAKAGAVVQRQVRHMGRLVADLLDISSVSAGKLKLERERMCLADAVRRLVQDWRASGRLAQHQLTLDLAPLWVDADRARIEQILANLLDNAVKFTPAGGRISVTVLQEEGDAVLRIADEGIGLDASEAGRVFDLFVQVRPGQGGLGIGLALVRRLAELHGGSVGVTSAGKGKGAAFAVRLPAVAEPQAEAAAGALAASSEHSILIVEDNEDARTMLAAALKLCGQRVRVAASGAAALEAATQAMPEIAIIDIGLPDLDGYEVARRLRAARGGRRTTLIALTGYGQPADQARAFDAGFDAHFTKPVSAERLNQMIARAKARRLADRPGS